MSFLKDNNDITYGIDTTVRQAMEKAMDNNNKESFTVINRFITKIILLSIKKDSLTHFEKYIIFYPWYYNQTFQKTKENNQFQNIHLFVSKISARQLKEILNYYLSYKKTDLNDFKYKNLEHQNEFFYKAFNSFSRLFYFIINNGDNNFFDYALNQFYQANIISQNTFSDLANEIKWHPKQTEEFNKKKDLHVIVSQYQNYKRHVITGIKYWSYFMYDVQKNNLETTLSFIEKLHIYGDSEELLRDIIFLRNQGYTGYFDWESWDFKERPDAQAYTPPDPRNWISLGFLIDLIRDGRNYFNPDQFNAKELEQISFLSDSIKQTAGVLIHYFEKWNKILKVETKEELELKFERIITIFEQFAIKNITDREKAIEQEPLSTIKIHKFRNLVGKKWETYSVIRELFLKYENRTIKNIENLEIQGYKKQLFGGAKIMFIDGDYGQDPNLFGDLGGEIAREIDDAFFEYILNKEPNTDRGENILQCIKSCIAKLKTADHEANLILVPSEYNYLDKEFLNNPEFILKRNLDGNIEKDMFLLGKYDNIPVYSCFNAQFKNMVLVCNFENSFKMNYAKDEKWYKKELQVEVSEVTYDEAKVIYDKDPSSRNRNGLKEFSETDVITNIRNGVYVDIASYSSFEILNKESFVIGFISENENHI